MIACRTLGPVAVTVDGAAPPPELLWRKHLAALVYLARSPHRTRSREHLVGLLWGDRPEPAARHSLREAIHVLRRAAGEAGVEAAGESVRLAEGAVLLDVDQLDAHVAAGRWTEAAQLVAGEFLEGFGVAQAAAFEDWLGAERLHWRARALEVLTHCSADAMRQGHVDEAAELGRRALRLDPASPAAARATMTAQALAGDRAAALETFDALAVRLAEAVGTAPDAETQALAERVRSGRTWQVPAAEAAPRRGAESRRAPLAGRGPELARLLDAWQRCRGERRAAVGLLEGDSGVGKTRLAEEVLERARLDGAAVSAVRAVPGDAAEELAGLVGLARGGLALARGVAGARPEALAAFVARVPEWAERFPGARGAVPLAPLAAFTETLRAAADEQPLLLFLDDAHWLDAPTLRGLAVLLRDLAHAPVFFLITCSSGSSGEELDALRERLDRDIPGAAVRLGALPAAALAALARWAFPAYSDVEVDRIARRVATDSAGLPLLAVELLHAVALGLDLHQSAGAWPAEHHTLDQSLPGDLPDAVVAAIRIGFRRLSRDAQAVLAAAAVLREKESGAMLGRAAGLSGERLRGALDEAEWQRWLLADGRGYSFIARIVRDVVARDMLTAGQRQRVLEAAGAETP